MIGKFENLLQELGKVFNLELATDKKNACSIQIHPHLVIQLQPDETQDNLWIFCKLAETPSGKFRENILKEALKSNALPDPRPGILAYISGTNQLAIFQKYPIEILTGVRLSGLLGAFLELADSYRDAIISGHSAPLSQKPSDLPNPFGML
jgi:hypothetical protein